MWNLEQARAAHAAARSRSERLMAWMRGCVRILRDPAVSIDGAARVLISEANQL